MKTINNVKIVYPTCDIVIIEKWHNTQYIFFITKVNWKKYTIEWDWFIYNTKTSLLHITCKDLPVILKIQKENIIDNSIINKW